MKNFFKILLCVLLVLTFVFTCVSCSSKKNKKNEGEDTKANSAGTADTKAPETAQQAEDPQQGSIDLGDYSYVSDTLGIGLKLNDEWTIRSPEELAALIGNTSFGEAIKNLAVVYDFYAMKGLGTTSIVIQFENMKKNYGRVYDDSEYVSLVKPQLKTMLEYQGMTVKTIDTVSRTVGGRTFQGFYVEMTSYGVTVCEYCLIKRCGDFMGNITLGALSVEELDQILALFYAL